MDKINLLSNGEKAIAGGGVLMFIASFFPWWRVSLGGFGSVSEGGWGSPGEFWSILAILISLALAGSVIVVNLGNVQMPALPSNITWGQVYGGGAAAVAVLMLFKAWRILDVPVGGFGIGFFLGVLAAAAIGYGGYLLYTEEKAGSSPA